MLKLPLSLRVFTLLGCSFLLLPALAAAARKTLSLGSPLPSFALPGVDGKTYTPASFASARLLALVFTSNHCPTAQAYEDRLKKLVRDFEARGVAFLAINPNHAEAVRFDEMGYTDLDDSFESMGLRSRDRGFNFPYVDDGPTQSFSELLGPVATPHVFLFDETRVLRFQGRIDDSEREDLVQQSDTRRALEALLAGGSPETGSTRVFGCSVKWREKADDNKAWLAKVAQEPVSLQRIEGEGLRALRAPGASDKLRMIHVWATWCGPCLAELPEIVETNLRFRHRDFELITVAAQFPDEEAKVLKVLQKNRVSCRNLIFGSTDKYVLIEALDPEWNGSLPHTLVLDPKGQVIYRESGPLNFLALRRALVPALNALSPWPGLSG